MALWRGRFLVARIAATLAVAAVLVGWGAGQYPWILADTATIEDAAAADATLWALVITFGLAAVTVVPSLAYLFWLTQRSGWARRERAAST
jgi:cytochrome d ubiquinol oxidase subunit II